MKNFSPALFFPLFIILLIAIPVADASDWVKFYTGEKGNVTSYKKVISENGLKRYVVKEVFSDQGRKEYLQGSKEKGLPKEDLEKLANIQSLSEINCREKKIKNISVFYFDQDGKKIKSHFVEQPRWVKAPDNDFFNALLKEVCR